MTLVTGSKGSLTLTQHVKNACLSGKVTRHRRSDHVTAWWRYVLFVLPVVPLVCVAWTVARLMSDTDELQRRIQLEALAFAFGAGSLVTFTHGLPQATGLPEVSWLFV